MIQSSALTRVPSPVCRAWRGRTGLWYTCLLYTSGTAVTMVIRNQNTRSGDYAKTADLLRPGHADYTAYAKYEGYQDARGGGHFSGRITAASVAAGALCESVLNSLGIRVYTHIAECAGIKDAPLSSSAGLLLPEPEPGHFALLDSSREAPMQEAIRAAGSEGDSVGGVLETIVTGLPAGIGEPWFDSVESELAHLMFAVPACKGLEFGAGFAFAQQMNTTAAQPQEPVVKEVIRIKCPNCGELNKEDAKFCCECGTSLITKKYCPQCGGEVETDSKFCSTCGQKL